MKSDVYNYDCVHYRAWYFNDPQTLTKQFFSDLVASNLDVNWTNDKFTFVVDLMDEGADSVLANNLINVISNHCTNCKVIAFVTSVSGTNTQTNIIETPWYMASHCNIHQIFNKPYQSSVDKKFLCLIRRASWSRARFAYSLIKAVPENLRISFDTPNADSTLYQDFFENIRLPLLIDGVEKHFDTRVQSNSLFWSCLFNVVVETSSQHDTNIWRTKFITEKTYKAFYMRQIPIWFAVPGLVEQVRQLGFDMFDDVIDHSYDGIEDEHFRIKTIVSQVERLDATYTTLECRDLRDRLKTRLEKNFTLAMNYASQTTDYKYKVIEQLKGT